MTKGSRAAIWVTLKVAMAWLQRHRPDLVLPGLELPFNPFPRRNQGACARPALAREEIKAVLAACRRDIEASWVDFQHGRELIAAASARTASIGEPTTRDLSDLGVFLAVLAQRHAGLLPEDGDLLAGDALDRRIRHALTYHGGAERVSHFLHTTPESILPYMMAIGARPFANPEALGNTRRGCMSEDLLIARLVHVAWH